MAKAVLSNRIFLETTPELRKYLNEQLTYSIPGQRKDEPPTIIRNMSVFKGDIVSIPSGRMDLIPEGYEIVDKRINSEVEFPEFLGTLRASQQEIWDSFEDSGIINAWVSFGKTFTALAIAGKLGQKTLIVTHTVPLRNQWVREIEKVYGFTPGIIGSGKFNTDSPIVVGNVQTLSKSMDKLYKVFGTIILDECHHCPASTFTEIVNKSAARYKVGLSGTLKRKDGRHVVLRDFFGDKIFQPPVENSMEPEIHIYNSGKKLLDNPGVPWAKKVNKILYDEEYQHFCALVASTYIAQGHKVLLVADRTEFLENVTSLIGDRAICITGAIKDHELREEMLTTIREDKDCICGTQSMFSEGYSESTLSCLILCTPIGNNDSLLEQLIGRVIRLLDGKLQPIVVDMNFLGNTAKKQNMARLGLYINKGWKVKTIV